MRGVADRRGGAGTAADGWRLAPPRHFTPNFSVKSFIAFGFFG